MTTPLTTIPKSQLQTIASGRKTTANLSTAIASELHRREVLEEKHRQAQTPRR